MNQADNAWVLASSALVLLMTPGLAMFYGGMTRSKNVSINHDAQFLSDGDGINNLDVLWIQSGLCP